MNNANITMTDDTVKALNDLANRLHDGTMLYNVPLEDRLAVAGFIQLYIFDQSRGLDELIPWLQLYIVANDVKS
jgi:hypothetical protein